MDIISFDREAKIPVFVPHEGKPIALRSSALMLDPELIQKQAVVTFTKLTRWNRWNATLQMRHAQFKKAAWQLAKRTKMYARSAWCDFHLFCESPGGFVRDLRNERRHVREKNGGPKKNLIHRLVHHRSFDL